MTRPHLSVVIPAYDEALRLPPTLETVKAWLAGQGFDWEIVVVDDGSRDATAELAREALSSCPHQVIRHDRNRGKGAGLRTGMQAALGEFVLYTDADLSTPIEEASRFLEAHRDGVPVVIGTRKSPGANVTRRQHPVRENMGRVFTWLSNVLVGGSVTDYTCGFKSFRADACRDVFSRLYEDGWAYDSEVLHLVRRLDYDLREIPVRWANDPSTRVNLLHDTLGSMAGLIRIRVRSLLGRYDRGGR